MEKIFTTEFSTTPEPAAMAAALVTATVAGMSAARKPGRAAINAMIKSKVALEPAERESNAIVEPMLDNRRDSCKENVARIRGPSGFSPRIWNFKTERVQRELEVTRLRNESVGISPRVPAAKLA